MDDFTDDQIDLLLKAADPAYRLVRPEYAPAWRRRMRAALTAALPMIRGRVVEECAKVAEELRHPNWSAENEDWCAGTLAAAAAIRAMGGDK